MGDRLPPLYSADLPSPEDVMQGLIPDCSLLGTLCAIAQSDPEFLANHISTQPGGWVVGLYKMDSLRRVQAETVFVEEASLFAGIHGLGREGRASLHQAAWPAVYERAYLTVWPELPPHAGEAFFRITGAPPETRDLSRGLSEIERLAQICDERRPVVAALKERRRTLKEVRLVVTPENHHAYWVRRLGTETVSLGDPRDPKKVKTMSFREFAKSCKYYEAGFLPKRGSNALS